MHTHASTKVLTAHVPTLLAEKIDQIASRLERSRTWVIKQALTTWVSEEEKYREMTLEALSDVDQGLVIDDQIVQNWVNGLDKEK